jgi:hypothetical protein
MLQVCTKAFDFESGPERDLMHGACMLTPLGEFVGEECEFALEFFYGVLVFVEEDLNVYIYISFCYHYCDEN